MPVQTAVFIAKVVEDEKNGYAKVEMRNRFKKGDRLEILSPSDAFGKTITIVKIINEKGEQIDDCKRVQEIVSISTPYHLQKGDILRVNKTSEN